MARLESYARGGGGFNFTLSIDLQRCRAAWPFGWPIEWRETAGILTCGLFTCGCVQQLIHYSWTSSWDGERERETRPEYQQCVAVFSPTVKRTISGSRGSLITSKRQQKWCKGSRKVLAFARNEYKTATNVVGWCKCYDLTVIMMGSLRNCLQMCSASFALWQQRVSFHNEI